MAAKKRVLNVEKKLMPMSMTVCKKRKRDFKQKGHEETRTWSNLPNDILSEIMEKVCVFDRLQCQAVCKGWLNPHHGVEHEHEHVEVFPWLMTYKWDKISEDQVKSDCKLYRPFCENKGPFIVEDGITNMGRENFVGARACASKFGWVLFCKEKECGKGTSFFLFAPFSKEIINLPNLDSNIDVASFSHSPNSPDCVFFVMHQSSRHKAITINVCGFSDQSWQTHVFEIDKIPGPIRSVVYNDGNFYCLFGLKTLATFSTIHKEFRLLTKVRPFDPCHYEIPHLLHSNGEVLVVYFDLFRRDSFRIFKFDWSKKTWVLKRSLKNQALFLGCNSFSVPAAGKAIQLANKVFYNHNAFSNILSYDFKNDVTSMREIPEVYGRDASQGLKTVWIVPCRCCCSIGSREHELCQGSENSGKATSTCKIALV
ncbi:F-box/kelch-repeat protein At1g57790-like [Fagus crenata]